MEKESITNEEFAELVKNGFDHVGEEIASLRTELKSELKSEISSLRTELKSEIHDLRVELKSEISDLRTEVHDGFMKTNDKVDLLTLKLVDKKVITKKDAEEVIALGPIAVS